MTKGNLNTPERQAEVRGQFREADAISKLEGYEPDAFEQSQKEKIISGEFTTDDFIAAMAAQILSGKKSQ